MSEKNFTDVLIEQLTKFKVKNIYSYAGDTILRLYAHIKDSPLNLYTTTHESTAGLMASAEAKLTGNLAVCVSHSGPGTANIINGIADAYSDRAPVLLISGQVETYNIGTNYKQYVDHLKLTEPLTVFSSIIINPNSLVDLLYKAMTTSLIRGGVSHLVIPMDLWESKTNALTRNFPDIINKNLYPDPEQIEKSVEKINMSKKPVIIYGRGIKDKRNKLLKLAKRISAPLINTMPAAGILNFNNEFSLGSLGLAGNIKASTALQDSDLIIILGANWWPSDYTPRQANIIQIDACKENIGATHPVETAILGDMSLILDFLLQKLTVKEIPKWKKTIDKYRKEWFDELKIENIDYNSPLDPRLIMTTTSKYIKKNEIISLDSGDHTIWFGKYFSAECEDVLISGNWRTMGFALPAANAAKINKSENPVTAITGDGGLIMILGELLNTSRYQLPIRIIVLNNNSLAMEKNRMKKANIATHGVELNNPDFIKIAEASGIESFRINNNDELEKIMDKTSNYNKAVLIDIPTAETIIPGTKLD